MKVKIKPSVIVDDFNIIKYVGNDLLAQEHYERIKSSKSRLKKVKEELKLNIVKARELIKKTKRLQYKLFEEHNEDECIDEEMQINKETQLVNEEAIRISKETKQIDKELDRIVLDFQIKSELKHKADNIVKKLKRKIHNLSEDRKLIDEIVKEENNNYKDFPQHINYKNLDIYYFIEPVIDFEVTDYILITDFKVRPMIIDRDLWKIDK